MTAVQGRTPFITGGANGIGLGIARCLAPSSRSPTLMRLRWGAPTLSCRTSGGADPDAHQGAVRRHAELTLGRA